MDTRKIAKPSMDRLFGALHIGNRYLRRVLSLILALALFAALPVAAMGSGGSGGPGDLEDDEYNGAAVQPQDAELSPAAMALAAAGFELAYPYPFQDPSIPAITRVNNLLSLLTLEEKINILISSSSPAVDRLSLKGFGSVSEGQHGAVAGGATFFPTSIGLSQTWNYDLMNELGYAVGLEMAANRSINANNAATRSPVVDLLRDPRFGRAYETYGEDAYLSGSLATAWASGLNARDDNGYQLILPELKHFMAYGNEVMRLWTNSSVSPRNLNEYYFKNFRYPIEAGAAKGLMNSYNFLNGVPLTVHPVLRDNVYGEWVPEYEDSSNLEFYTETDGDNGFNLYRHNQYFYEYTVEGRAMAAADSMKVGTQLQLGAGGVYYRNHMLDALARGYITEADIDNEARKFLMLRLRIGALDHFDSISTYRDGSIIGTLATNAAKNKELALRAAQESIVLLKNDGALPLSGAQTDEVVLLGLFADTVQRGYYSPTSTTNSRPVSIKEAFENKLGQSNVKFDRPVDKVAIMAPNGQYLVAPRTVAAGGTLTATGGGVADGSDATILYDLYDLGGDLWMMGTPENGRFVALSGTGQSNDSTAGIANSRVLPGNSHDWYNQQLWMLPALTDSTTPNQFAMYNAWSGNWENNELNHGMFFGLNAAGQVVRQGQVGRYDTPERIAELTDAQKFVFDTVVTKQSRIDSAIAAADADAPIILVLGYEAAALAHEGQDQYKMGLSEGQMDVIRHIAALGKDMILIVQGNNPMIVNSEVKNNSHVKAIMCTSAIVGQEEGIAIVSALFDDGAIASSVGSAASQNSYRGPANDGVIPPFAPAGRLSATWYESLDDIVGASEDHSIVSYRHPVYDEDTNDNNSKLHGTIPTGITSYDNIKSERTYQYTKKEPTYAFGHGLTYTPFEYSNVQVSAVSGGKFTISVDVKNAGATYTSDEVVQFYGAYDQAQARQAKFEQPNKRLIAYERLKNVAPGETRNVTVEVDLADKLGVWDMTRDMLWAEPGEYIIEAARSSADSGSAKGALTVIDTEMPYRDLTQVTLAQNFNDYSELDKMELVHNDYDGTTATLFNAQNQWISFTDVDFTGKNATRFTALVSADRDTTLNVYSGEPGAGGVIAGTFALEDTRPDISIPSVNQSNQGKGPRPGSGTPNAVGLVGWDIGYTASATGGLDSGYFNNIQLPIYTNEPEWKLVSFNVSGLTGIQDIYISSSQRGAAVAWFKFSAGPDATESISILSADKTPVTQSPRDLSIREQGAALQLLARLEPVTSADAVTWTVTNTSGGPTGIATIDKDSGLLQSIPNAGNGTVRVTASAGGKSASADVLVTNQFDINKYTGHATRGPVTIDYLTIRAAVTNYYSANTFSVSDSIILPGATRTLVLSYKAPEFDKFDDPRMHNHQSNGDVLPNSMASWTVTDLDGNPTDLATITQAGVLRATDKADGKVLVTAVYALNPDIYATKVITLFNQGTKSAYKALQPTLALTAAGTARPTITAAGAVSSTNEVDYYINNSNATIRFNKVDFKNGATGTMAYIRLAHTATREVGVWIDAATAGAGGTLLGTLEATGTTGGTGIFDTYELTCANVEGVHDVYITFSGAASFKFIQFTADGVAPDVDKDALQALYDDSEDIDKSGYTDESWAEFVDAMDEALMVLLYKYSTQADVDAAYDRLGDAVGNLTQIPVDKSALWALYSDLAGTEKGFYTNDSWDAFQDALTKALVVYDKESATQKEVDDAYDELSDAFDALALIGSPYVTIAGPAAVVSGSGATANYIVSVANAPAVSGIEIEFEVDGDFISSKEFTALNGFGIIGDGNYGTPIYWRNVGNIWIGKATLLHLGSVISGNFELLELGFDVKEGVLGDAAVKLNKVTLSNLGAEVDASIVNGSAVTTFTQYYSPYDLNHDGVIDIHDITYAMQFLLAYEGGPDWDEAKDMDYNGDKMIDINDLILILANYTVPYYN